MIKVMRHPNGRNTLNVSPEKVERMKKLGWTLEDGATAEVLEFQQAQKDKVKEFIGKSKQDSIISPIPIPGVEPIKEPVQTANEETILPDNTTITPAYDEMTNKELVAEAMKIPGTIEKDLRGKNKVALIKYITGKEK